MRAGGERVMVRLFEVGGDGAAPIFIPAGELLAAGNAALAGVLNYDGRRGAAVPSLRVGRDAATLSPCDGLPLTAAVELAYGGDDPQEVPLQVAIAALGLEWQLLTPARDGAAGTVVDGAGARGGALPRKTRAPLLHTRARSPDRT
eukprot:6208958-Pleurochrysis_carterae.AAC.1